MKNKSQLPDKPSELLIVALADLEKCERSKKFHIEMAYWFMKNDNDGICEVCLAGAVMAQSCPLPGMYQEGALFEPQDYPEAVEKKLKALNYLRIGNIDDAFNLLSIRRPKALPVQMVAESDYDAQTHYTEVLHTLSQFDRKQWKLHMLDLVGILQAEGF